MVGMCLCDCSRARGPWRDRRGTSREGRTHRRSRKQADCPQPGKNVAPSPRKGWGWERRLTMGLTDASEGCRVSRGGWWMGGGGVGKTGCCSDPETGRGGRGQRRRAVMRFWLPWCRRHQGFLVDGWGVEETGRLQRLGRRSCWARTWGRPRPVGVRGGHPDTEGQGMVLVTIRVSPFEGGELTEAWM